MRGRRAGIGEAELAALCRDLDALHHDLLPGLRAAADGLGEALRARSGVSRRAVLRGGLAVAGVLGGGAVLGACGGGSSPAATVARSPVPPSPSAGSDAALARRAAGLEVAAVSAYDALLDLARRGSLGTVPPSVATLLTVTRAQHADHGSAWASALAAAGASATASPDAAVTAMVGRSLPAVSDVVGAARLALNVEAAAVETYTGGALTAAQGHARSLALAVAPVEAQHAAILEFLLGGDPAPDAFARTGAG